MQHVFQRMITIEWKFLLGFFADITQYFNSLNLGLQGEMKSIVDLYCVLKDVVLSLPFMEEDLRISNFDRFPKCASVMFETKFQPDPVMLNHLADRIKDVRRMFCVRFQDLSQHASTIRLLLNPFNQIEWNGCDSLLQEELTRLNAD